MSTGSQPIETDSPVSPASLAARSDCIAVVGLGYVGLPLAVHLARYYEVVGFDIKTDRIRELAAGNDRTLEVSRADLAAAHLTFSSDAAQLQRCRFIVVAVPTPIDEHHNPDLAPVISASRTVAEHLALGSCIVYESTVYPGVTEEVCVPILEETSGMQCGHDFKVGYSPERINPGDKVHTLESIIKVVAASDEPTLDLLTEVYGRVVQAGIHRASSIKVAEAAKVIENTQRDLNIALMNELAMIFDKMQIDTSEVLAAAGTKWNFLPFRPGLVGGHCIGVDPYYLTFKAEAMGYHPQMILAGRRINDNMGKFIAEKTVKLLIQAGNQVRGARVAVLGLTFKENVPDLRNTRVIDIVAELQDYHVKVAVHDPLADPAEARHYYGIDLQALDKLSGVNAVILAVAHDVYRGMSLDDMAALCSSRPSIVVDVKSLYDRKAAASGELLYWRL